MEKLIIAGNHGTCEGDNYPFVIPFEYFSKDQFILDCIDGKLLIDNKYIKFNDSYHYTTIDQILYETYTLDEWFHSNKDSFEE